MSTSVTVKLLILSIIGAAVSDEKVEKIVNGIVAAREDFPFQAALLLKQKHQVDVYLCGGALVSSRVVVTAGHCLWNVNRGILILGTAELTANDTAATRHFLDAENFKIHPKFNFLYAFMDIGLVKLTDDVEFGKFIQPLALPTRYQLDETFIGDIGTVAGYGRFCDSCGTSSVLRYANNRIISTDECSSFVGLLPSTSQLCVSTAETRASACRGDSGGALTVVRNDIKIQVGISSFGADKCEDGRPAVFTRLTRQIVEWIEGEVKDAGGN